MTFRDWKQYRRRQRVYAYMRAAKFWLFRLTRKLPWRKRTHRFLVGWGFSDKPFYPDLSTPVNTVFQPPTWTPGADIQHVSRTGRKVTPPNMQNITPKTEEGRRIIEAIHANYRRKHRDV